MLGSFSSDNTARHRLAMHKYTIRTLRKCRFGCNICNLFEHSRSVILLYNTHFDIVRPLSMQTRMCELPVRNFIAVDVTMNEQSWCWGSQATRKTRPMGISERAKFNLRNSPIILLTSNKDVLVTSDRRFFVLRGHDS